MASLPPLSTNYSAALRLIDEAHAQDPNKIPGPDGSGELAYELHYAQKMTRWLAQRCPDASPALQVACRAQHFRRFVTVNTPLTGHEAWTDDPEAGSYHEAATP
jgi:hypothetical protein